MELNTDNNPGGDLISLEFPPKPNEEPSTENQTESTKKPNQKRKADTEPNTENKEQTETPSAKLVKAEDKKPEKEGGIAKISSGKELECLDDFPENPESSLWRNFYGDRTYGKRIPIQYIDE